jgi:serine/threonine-protein kinase
VATLGGYELVGKVGQGASATVWKANDARLARTVALKQAGSTSSEQASYLRTEAATLAALDDEHIVAVYGFFEESGSAYLVEQWIDGATLSAVVATSARFTTQQALGVARGALLGLSHAHARGVTHGDVSAANILVDLQGVSRLIDFGFSASGTPAYRSPEVAAGGQTTPASDVYSAAAVLVHLLTGQAATPPATGGVDAALRQVLDTALADEPAQRYPTATEFLAALEAVAVKRYGTAWWTQAGVGALVAPAVAGVVAVETGGATATAVVAGSHTGRLLIAIGAAAVIVVGGGVVALAATHHKHTTPHHASPPAAAAPAVPSSSASPVSDDSPSPSPAALVPQGVWQIATTKAVVTQRSGAKKKQSNGDPSIWTFSPSQCTGSTCVGTISSSSGRTFPYRWDGKALRVTAPRIVSPHAACLFGDTGKPEPKSEGNATVIINQKIGPFTGSTTRMTATDRETHKYVFYGDCTTSPTDTMSGESTFVLTYQHA